MMDFFRPAPAPVQWPAVQTEPLPGAGITRHYQLIVVATPGVGQGRALLGLRWHLPIYEQMRQGFGPVQGPVHFAKPYVLRAAMGEWIETQITNLLPHTSLCLGLVDDDYGILEPAGAGEIAPGESLTCVWRCRHAGIYPIYNRACPDPLERRNLLGVLIVEP